MLTKTQVERYQTHGYLIVRQVVTGGLFAQACAKVDALVAGAAAAGARPEKLEMPHRDDPDWLAIARAPALVEAARQLLGTADVVLFASHLLCKPGGDGLPVPLHQDAGYWPLEPMEAVTAWLAFDTVDDGNGCVRFLPGSHGWGPVEHETNPGPEATKVLHLRIPESRRGSAQFESALLEPGDASFHHPFTLHYSTANRSTRRRAGYTLRYVPRKVRIGAGWPFEPAFVELG